MTTIPFLFSSLLKVLSKDSCFNIPTMPSVARNNSDAEKGEKKIIFAELKKKKSTKSDETRVCLKDLLCFFDKMFYWSVILSFSFRDSFLNWKIAF
jgi:hypothetical protein